MTNIRHPSQNIDSMKFANVNTLKTSQVRHLQLSHLAASMHTCCLHVDLYCFSMGYIADPARDQTCDRDIGQLCAGSDFVLPKWLCILAVPCIGCDQKCFQLFRTPEISHPSCNSKTSAALTCATLLALGSKARASHSNKQQRKCSTAKAL